MKTGFSFFMPSRKVFRFLFCVEGRVLYICAAIFLEDENFMKTYDIYFSDGNLSDNKGFSIRTPEKAIHMAEDMLVKGNTYIDDYAGGTISVVGSDGETVWSRPIPKK